MGLVTDIISAQKKNSEAKYLQPSCSQLLISYLMQSCHLESKVVPIVELSNCCSVFSFR